MAHPGYLRDKARQLRVRKRLSLLEIAERLALPKTTVYYWIKDLPSAEIRNQRNSPPRARARAKGNRSMQRKYAMARQRAYEQGWQEFDALATDPTFRDFVCLYIGEGFKRNRNVVSLANSDPAVIRVADYWIRRLATNRVHYSFQHHADQEPTEVIAYWAEYLSVDPGLFRFQRKSNSGALNGRSWRSVHGVLSVVSNDTQLRARLQAWMDRLTQQWIHSPRGA